MLHRGYKHKYMYVCTLSLRTTFETKSADVIVKEIVRVEKFALCMKMKPRQERMMVTKDVCL
jgi:hypothetical protein